MVSQRASEWPKPGPTRRRRRDIFGGGVMLNLAQYDQKRMAVVVPMGTSKMVLRGDALYVHDATLGNCLRIDSQQEAGVEFLLQEDQFAGRIVKDDRYGCDYCVSFGENLCKN